MVIMVQILKNIKYRNMSINEAINEANIDCNILKKDVFLTKTSIGTFFLKNPQTTKIRFCLEELNFNIKHGIKKIQCVIILNIVMFKNVMFKKYVKEKDYQVFINNY